jgi:hypothetical protein
LARILAGAALAVFAAAAIAQLHGPPDVQIPASFKRRPDIVPTGAVLIGYNAPSGFIYYFPQTIRDVKHGYEVRSAAYSLSRVNPNDDVVALAVSYIRCGPGPVGTLTPFRSRVAPEKGGASFQPSQLAEISAWLAAPISDAEWAESSGIRARNSAVVMSEPMATPPNRVGYFEEVLIRAVCSTQPARS